jgi:hypothetical protein
MTKVKTVNVISRDEKSFELLKERDLSNRRDDRNKELQLK